MTGQSYATIGKAFIGVRGKGFVIAKRDIPAKLDGDGEKIKATPRQWGAWMAYFRRIGYRNHYLLRADYWTVPAEWPHQFDMTATVAEDYAEADDYERNQAAQRFRERQFNTSSAVRQAAARKYFQHHRPTPEADLKPKAPGPFDHIDISDFPNR